jgi:hypothetical protein
MRADAQEAANPPAQPAHDLTTTTEMVLPAAS